MRLHSDFIDYYDHHFSNRGAVFQRFSNRGMTREEMFDFLTYHGYKTPLSGLVRNMYNPLNPYKKVVVYTDNTAHRGEGKQVMSLLVALNRFPNHFCSHFIEGSAPISYRHLQVGEHQFRLVYHSLTDDWRSNVGEVEIQLIDQGKGKHSTITDALFAVDFVKDGEEFYAVDYNIAPQLKGTGVEDILSPEEVVKAITDPFRIANGW